MEGGRRFMAAYRKNKDAARHRQEKTETSKSRRAVTEQGGV